MKLPTSVSVTHKGEICLEWAEGAKAFTIYATINEAFKEHIEDFPRVMEYKDIEFSEFEFNKAIDWVML